MFQTRARQVFWVVNLESLHVLLNALEHDVGCEWKVPQTNPNGVVNGVDHRWQNGKQRPLPGFFCPKGTFGVARFNDDGFNMRHFMHGRNFVFQEVGVLKMAGSPIDHFFRDNLTKTHVTRTDDLTCDGQWIQGFATVVSSPYVRARNPPSFHVNINFCDISRERVSRRQPCRCSLVDTTHGRRTVSASSDESARVLLGLVKGLKVGNADSRIMLVVDSSVVENQHVGMVTQHFPGSLQQLVAYTDGGSDGGVGVHERNPT